MSDESISCPQCGKPLTSEAPAGLCPRCVMEMNLQPDTIEHRPGAIPPVEELAPHFPQLEILECLGRGGMGIVYKARQPQLDRFVALKILAPERVDDPLFAERFKREAVSLARLDHPNIVTVYDTGESGGFYYLLMEFVDGLNLREAIAGEKMPAREALAIVPPICAGLQYAHDNGVVHRDIKPENILLDRKGRVKIADFGVAKLVRGADQTAVSAAADDHSADPGLTRGSQLGTPQYMAPEQEAGAGEADHRADIYALGVVLYEMLTGERPQKDLIAPSHKVEVDVRIDEIVLRALEKEPAKRYQSAGEFRTMVETIATSDPAATPTVPDAPPPPAPAKRSKSPVVPIVIGCLASLLVIPLLLSILGIVVGLTHGCHRKVALNRVRMEQQQKLRDIQEIERLHLERDAAEAGMPGEVWVEPNDHPAAQAGNPLEGSFRGTIEGKDVEWHIIEFMGGYRWIENPSTLGGGLFERDGSLFWGDHSKSFQLSLVPGSSGLRFERLSAKPESDGETTELTRVSHGIETMIARKDSKGVIRWADEVMTPFFLSLGDLAKGTGHEDAAKTLLQSLVELREAATTSEWEAVGRIRKKKILSPNELEGLRKLLRSHDESTASQAESDRSGHPGDADEVARAHMQALRELNIDRALELWNEVGEPDPRRREQMLRNARELMEVYAQDPVRLINFTEWLYEERYAVARVAPPKGGDRTRSLYLILSKSPTGWGIVDMDDIRADQSLREKLNHLLDR